MIRPTFVIASLLLTTASGSAVAESAKYYGLEIRPSFGVQGQEAPDGTGLAWEMQVLNSLFASAEITRAEADYTERGVETNRVSHRATTGLRYYMKGVQGVYGDSQIGLEQGVATYTDDGTTRAEVTSLPVTVEAGYRFLVGPFSFRAGFLTGYNFVIDKQVGGDGPEVEVADATLAQISTGFGYFF